MFAVLVERPEEARATFLRVMSGPFAFVPARYLVLVAERESGRVMIRQRVDSSERNAENLAALFRADLGRMNARDFLERHGGWGRRGPAQ